VTAIPTHYSVTIAYTYNGLSRLTAGDYSNGDYYHYSYDAVGNRLNQTTKAQTTNYTYDSANRLASANELAYQWDDNGNMLNDGTSTYSYNSANRLIGVTGNQQTISYKYNGLGDRLQQISNGTATDYTVDINSGLTQVLDDGSNKYLYGAGRIAQIAETQTGYFLPDALGSMRQMTDSSADLTLARSYDPYGNVVSSSGPGETVYGYTGEMQSNGLVHLRARDYASQLGRFTSRDTWEGDSEKPLSMNKWLYVEGDSINNTDPSGFSPTKCLPVGDWDCETVTNVSLLKQAFFDSARRHNNIPSMDNNGFAALIASIIVSEQRIGGRVSTPKSISTKITQTLEDISSKYGCLVSGHAGFQALLTNDWRNSQLATVGIGNIWLATANNLWKNQACDSTGVCTPVQITINSKDPYAPVSIFIEGVGPVNVSPTEYYSYQELAIQLQNDQTNIEYVAANLEAGSQRATKIGLTPSAFNSAAWHLKGIQSENEIKKARWNPCPLGACLILEEIPNALAIWGVLSNWNINVESEYAIWKSQ